MRGKYKTGNRNNEIEGKTIFQCFWNSTQSFLGETQRFCKRQHKTFASEFKTGDRNRWEDVTVFVHVL